MKDLPSHPVARSINLAFNAGLAAAVPWFQLPRAIFGEPSSYANPPPWVETELAALFPLSRAALGTIASATLSVPILGRHLRRGSGPIECPGKHAGAHPDQRWFFINGLSADARIAVKNAEALSATFGRPFVILYNATEGFAFDLYESAAGKGFETITDSASKNFEPVVEALADERVERVVLISHSQGTIIASVLLKALQELVQSERIVRSGAGAQKESPERRVARKIAGTSKAEPQPRAAKPAAEEARGLTEAHLRKLELYCFANCSTSMTPIGVVGHPPFHVPWIESYGNEYDVVARLGVLAPPHGIGSARIEGDRYRRSGTWGHLMNAHYLIPMIRDLEQPGQVEHELQPLGPNLRQRPRLYEYYRGRTPPPYP